ncbi:MAG: hypothetical protein JWP47_2271 [Polaromonas sp.]|jgi:predicted lipid-binding transport protein (Tim44 family)|nr:hypothetical protein [Polaromonas sp.]
MRSLFGVLSLLVVLALVGALVKKQLASSRQAVPALAVPAHAAGSDASAPAAATVREQSQQIQQQYKQALEQAMQQPRAVPDEK